MRQTKNFAKPKKFSKPNGPKQRYNDQFKRCLLFNTSVLQSITSRNSCKGLSDLDNNKILHCLIKYFGQYCSRARVIFDPSFSCYTSKSVLHVILKISSVYLLRIPFPYAEKDNLNQKQSKVL